MWHLVFHTHGSTPWGGEVMGGGGGGAGEEEAEPLPERVPGCGDLRILRSSSPALPLGGGGWLLLFSSFSFSLLGLVFSVEGSVPEGMGPPPPGVLSETLLRWFMTARLVGGRWFMVPLRLWITEISFIFPGNPGAKPLGKPGNGGNGNISLGGRGNPPKNSPSFGPGKVGGSVSMDIRLPRRDGELFHMCVPMCTLRLPLVVKALWQMVHLKGFSPVWVRLWICRAEELEKGLLQT